MEAAGFEPASRGSRLWGSTGVVPRKLSLSWSPPPWGPRVSNWRPRPPLKHKFQRKERGGTSLSPKPVWILHPIRGDRHPPIGRAAFHYAAIA